MPTKGFLSSRPVVVLSVLVVALSVVNPLMLAAGPVPAQNGAAATPKIWLGEAQVLPVQHVPVTMNTGKGMMLADSSVLSGMGQSQPVTMTSADLDGDGFDDLVVGYSTGNGGFIAIHRGNIDAFAPQSDASFQAIAHGQFASPFLLQAKTFNIPISPDFIAVGDFTGKGNKDLAVASKAGDALYIYSNDGQGNFAEPQIINLAGAATALTAGEFGASHMAALVVGMSDALAVYVPTPQGLIALANYPLSTPASNILFGNFGDPGPDVAFLTGGQIEILRSSTMQLSPVSLPVSVRAFTLGSFIFDRNGGSQIALVASDGSVQIAARIEFDPRVYTVQEFSTLRQARINRQPLPAFVPSPSFPANGWQIVESFAGAGAIAPNQTPVLFRTRISVNGADDVMLLNAFSGQMLLISHGDGLPGAQTFSPGQASLRPYSGSPIAALPMRLNIDGRPGVLALHKGEIAPALMEAIPDPTFFVNKDTDTAPTSPIANACNNTSFTDLSSSCSLREAILKANGDTIMLQAGHTYSLTIGRGATQDYSGNTGALYMNRTATIVGGNQNTTIIQWGTPGTGTVDLVMAVNEDIPSAAVPTFTNATGSLSNLTIQNGVNHGTIPGQDGFAGGIEFDTGLNGTANLTLTNVTVTNNSTTDGDGGGLAIFNTNDGAGAATITNSIISNNTPNESSTGGSGLGGGIYVGQPGSVILNNTQITGNNAIQNNNPKGQGGGIWAQGQTGITLVTTSAIHGGSISGNHATGEGGGINTTQGFTIDSGAVISGNTSGVAGGGIWYNAGTGFTTTLSKVVITNNSVTGSSPTGIGGGVRVDSATGNSFTMSLSRLAGNTATTAGNNLSNGTTGTGGGTVTATDNWWGTNTPATTINNQAGTTTFDPFIVLSNTPSPNPITLGQTTTLTASFLQDNHGAALTTAQISLLLGLPLTFGNPIDGTLSNSEAAIQPVNISTATESGSTVTITTTIAHGYAPGETVVVAGVGVAGYNGTFTIASTPTTTTFTYTDATTGLANSSGGTAAVGAAGTATSTFQSTLAGTGHADATVDQGTATANITIQKGNTTATLTSSVNPSVFGQSVTFTATVSPVAPAGPPTTVAPTGTVTFLDGGSPIGTGTVNSVTGVATFATTALAVGNHTITASYAGDSNYNGSTASLTGNPQVVNKANTATTVTSSANPSVFGQSVTFTATVSAVAPGSGTATGTVTFLDGGSPIGTGTLSGGIATFTTSALAVGNHTITTNYGGDGNFNGSTGSLTGNPQVVNKANTATTVTSSSNPSVFGQSVTFTATVSAVAPGSGTATGTVTFLDGGSPIGTGTLTGGIATFSTSALTVGNHTITTNYGGDGNFNGSTGSLTGNPQVVNKANTATTVTSSLNPSVFGQSVTFTATVSPVAPGAGTATGTVTFLDGGSPIGTGTLTGGIATFATSALTVGNHTITTSYGGDGNFNGSTGSLTGNPQVVNKANTATTVTSSVNPSIFGQSVTFTATVSPVAPGAGTPVGTVTFLDGGSPIGTGTLSGGIATFATSALAVGNHTITTNYGGDGNFNGSTGSLTGNPQVVNKTNSVTTVTSSVNPSVFGQSVTFTATVSAVAPGAGTPTGTVTFLDGGSPIGSGTLIGGIATFATSALAIGNHTITTNYGGDGNFNGSTGSLTGNPQVVNKADTAQTVTSSQNPQTAGQPITFTATVSAVAPGSGTATGTVTFLDGGSPIGSGTLSGGIATFTTSTLAPGNHTITTNYGGDGNFNGSTGSLTGNPQVITQASTTTTVTASASTITLGDTVTFTATVTAASGTATGLVTFFDGNTPLGSAPLNGTPGNDQATFPTSLLSASGSPHSITATYQGATQFAASTSAPFSETVNPRTSSTGVVMNPTTVVVGQSSTATVTVTDSGSVPPGTADTFQTTGAPITGRTGFTATLIADGAVLITGGTDANNNVLNTAEVFAGGTFTATPGNLNTARTGAVAVLLPNARVLIAGGSSDGTANGALNSAELLDPNTGTFVPTSTNMTAARFGATITLLNTGKVLISGGANSGGVLNSAELYDPATDTFTATGNLNAARAGASATLLGTGKVLVAGGSSDGTANGALTSAEVFDPAGNAGAGTFTSVAGTNPTLAAGRWLPEAALLLSGKVLVAGGENSGGALTSADLYDPVADSFTPSAHSMSQARANGSAVALPSGMVLLAGGTTSQAVDLYDGDSDKFNTTGSLQQSDAGLVSTLLNNGQVLAVGLTTAATPASDAELYSPSFNPLGTVVVTSSEATDGITGACTLTPSTSTASTCTSTVTPVNVATSPHTITGTYPADAVHSTSNGTASLTVNKADTTTTVTSSVNPSVFGQSVTFTATISPVAPGTGTPTGTVTFLDGGSPIGTGTLSGGIATFTTSALAVGNHTITTSYGGDGNFNGSTGSLTGNPQVVNKANTTTTVTSSVNPSVFGQSVTFTATVSAVAPGSGTATGTVTFLDGGSPIGTGTLSGGIATFTTSALAVGNHTITTNYGGDGNFNGSTGSLTGNPQVVNKADTSTTVTSSVNPSVFGQSVTFTATVSAVAPGSGTPVGTVTFLDGGSPIGTGTLSGGVATFTTSALAVGNHTITTSYGGDGNFNGSTGSLTGNPQVVNKADTSITVTSSLNPSTFGQSVTFTATVSAVAPGAGTPTGTVTFLDGGSPIGTGTLSGGIATFTTSALTAGNHTITTSYGGDGNFNGSTGSLTGNPQVVNKANTTTAVTSSANPSVFGQSVTFTATVSAVAPGAGTPTGTVTFLDGGNPIGSGTLSGGIATFSTSALAVGNHTITTSYGGDGNFNGSTGSLTGNPQVVNKDNTVTTVASSANPSVVGQSVTFTATVSPVAPGAGTPTGTVTFLDGGSPIGSGTLSGGIATFTTSALVLGNHTITTTYGGDGNFNGSTGSLTGNPQVVTQAGTTTAVGSSAGTITLGDTVTFTATVTVNAPGTGTPTGLVTFFNGSTPIGSGALNGSAQATFSTAVLPVGSNAITAIYHGDANFSASPVSPATTETVNLRASTTGVVLNPTTVSAGQPSTITTTVTDGGASNPPGTADSFTATGAPATGRTGFTSTLFADGLVLVAGGTDANGNVLKSAEIYSVSGGAFSTTGNLNTARTGAVAVLLSNGKVLIAGGSSSASSVVALQTAELFDPIAGTFTATSPNMTAARFGATATLLGNGKVLIAGGQNSSVVNSAELYDPAGDTFTATGNLNTARGGHSATLLGNGKVLVAGGSSNGTASGALNGGELFDPTGNSNAGTFTAISSTLSDTRWQPEAAVLLSGKVLVAGGQNSGNGVLTSADLYDPIANSFTATTHAMNEAHANGSAVALPNGMVLLPGGTTSQTVDLYDGDSDKFNTTGSLAQHLSGSAATLLNNGQVLVVGLTTVPGSDAELYSPSFNPLGTVGFGSSDGTDVFGTPCVLTPGPTSTASTCTSTVTPGEVGTSPHTITGTYPSDAVHSGSNNTASLTVIPTAPPTIAKAFGQNNVAQNGTVGLSFTIVNPNPGATLTGVSFTDALPAGLVVATPNNVTSNCGGTFTAVSGSSAISLTGGTIAPVGPGPFVSRRLAPRSQVSGPNPPASGECVITLNVLVTGTGTISNTTGPVSANESGPGNPSNTATINVVLPATANKAFGAATIPVGGTTSLTFNIANPNATFALVNIALSDTLPSGLIVATPNGAAGTCLTAGGSVTTAGTLTAAAASGSINLSGLSLNPSGSCSFSVNVAGKSGGTQNNTTAPITATFDDGTGTFRLITGGSASASITVVAPPAISKAFVPPVIAPSGVSALTFTITNPAANSVAESGVSFTDTLPANVVVSTPNGLSGNCNGGTVTAVAGSGSISLAGGSIPAASSCVISVNVTSSVVGNYTNTTGNVTSTNGGVGNTASATLSVGNASLSITKTHAGSFPRGSSNNNYTITVSNGATAGPTVGTVTVTDTLPNSNKPMVPTAMSGTGWTCTLATLTCTRMDSLAPGASYPPITLTVTVPKDIQANVTNSATVSGGGDPNSHTANDPTHIGPPIDITLAINAVTINVGGTGFVNFTVDSSPGEGTINFACSGLPFGASCSFNPPSTNQLSTNVAMGVTTSAGAGSLLPPAPGKTPPPLYAAVLPLLGLMVGFAFRRKNKIARIRWAFALTGLALFLALMGCGGTQTAPPTPQGTFQVTITATSAVTGDSGSAVVAVTVPQ